MKYIFLNTAMVRAYLAGDKIQTRRIIPRKITCRMDEPRGQGDIDAGYPFVEDQYGESISVKDLSPYKKGDILYVREKFAYTDDSSADIIWDRNYIYATDPRSYLFSGLWKPSVQMPRRAARLYPEVTEVRIERVRDISNNDAWCEGVCNSPEYDCVVYFKELWQSRYPGSWERNDWVWVYDLTPSKQCAAFKHSS